MSDDKIQDLIDQTGSHELGVTPDMVKDLGDDTYVMIKPLMFHWTMIRGDFGDFFGYFDRWCYETREMAEDALDKFPLNPDPSYEPSGWHRHPKTGRRRESGDPELETFAP